MAGRGDGDGQVPHGRLLVAFADAVVRGSSGELDAARDALSRVIGSEALADAAAIAAIFSCNVRVADATGIALDEADAEVRERFAARVGIARFTES